MLQGRLTAALAGILALALTGCAGADGTERGAIRENVIEPGITAIDQADEFACSTDASVLRTALQSYELLVGDPAPDEAVLVTEGFLRSESDLWDVVDGALVPADPGCGDVPADVEATEIITSTEAAPAADEVLDGFSAEQIEAVGGRDCATELAAIFAGAERYVAETGLEPADLVELVDAGYLDELPRLWRTVGDELLPTDGGGCTDLSAGPGEVTTDEGAAACTSRLRTLQVATEAFVTQYDRVPLDQQELVDVDFLRDVAPGFTITGGAVLADVESECSTLLDSRSGGRPAADALECDDIRSQLEAAIASSAVTGAPADSQVDLLRAGAIPGIFVDFTISPDGQLAPTADSICG